MQNDADAHDIGAGGPLMPIRAGADHVLSCPGLPAADLVEAVAVEPTASVLDDAAVVVTLVPLDDEAGAVWVTVFVVLAPLAQAAAKTTVATVTRQSTRRALILGRLSRARLSWEPPRLPRQARAAACHAPHWPTEVLLQK
jgi:hypothetical protein